MRLSQDDLARIVYTAYGYTTNFKNFRGEEMPNYCDLPDRIKEAWKHAALVAREIGEKYILEKMQNAIEKYAALVAREIGEKYILEKMQNVIDSCEENIKS